MLKASEVGEAVKKCEASNLRFRSYLKNHADSAELDAHFLKLHKELFAAYDCSKCRNCCKSYDTDLEKEEIRSIAAFLELAEEEFTDRYLTRTSDGFNIKGPPCCFLGTGGQCQIEECRPSACKDFPFTDRPGRLQSLLGILEFAEICPVVFEMLERLKAMYHFRK